MLLDIGFGILGAMAYAAAQAAALDLRLILISIAFALLPDLDFIFQGLRRGGFSEVDATHRDLIHNPIIYVLAGSALVALWDIGFVPLFTILSLLHFLHDSVGIGWGVRWFYPFSKRYYKFFSEYDGSWSWNFLTSWTADHFAELEEGRKKRWNGKKWFEIIYFRPHPINIIELAVFLAAVVALWHQLYL